jgi:hypothetical protein
MDRHGQVRKLPIGAIFGIEKTRRSSFKTLDFSRRCVVSGPALPFCSTVQCGRLSSCRERAHSVAIEEPKFDLILKDGEFEVRDYAASVVAEVTVTGDQQQAGSKGFRLLAGYIFGGNAKHDTIAMTAPVTKMAKGETIAMTAPVTQIEDDGQWLVRFTMPSKFALIDLPEPNDKAVTIRALPSARFAVLRFSGLAGEMKVASMKKKLLEIVKVRGMLPVGPSSIAQYNPPWTLWFLRRNEVMVPVAMT